MPIFLWVDVAHFHIKKGRISFIACCLPYLYFLNIVKRAWFERIVPSNKRV